MAELLGGGQSGGDGTPVPRPEVPVELEAIARGQGYTTERLGGNRLQIDYGDGVVRVLGKYMVHMTDTGAFLVTIEWFREELISVAKEKAEGKASTALSRSTNPKELRDYIYSYLTKNMRVTQLQAIAILGNISVETWDTFSPLILQGSSSPDEEYAMNAYKANDSKGWGLLQWTYSTRKQALLDYANSNPAELKTGDINVQLGYFNHERNGLCKSDWNIFIQKDKLDDLVGSFCNDYERAAIPHLEARRTKAREYAKEYDVSFE